MSRRTVQYLEPARQHADEQIPYLEPARQHADICLGGSSKVRGGKDLSETTTSNCRRAPFCTFTEVRSWNAPPATQLPETRLVDLMLMLCSARVRARVRVLSCILPIFKS